MFTVLWILAGLALGSLPFSYWVGRMFLKKDIRDYGDGNPGATNVYNAGGLVPYFLAILLDAFKAAGPVWLAQVISHVGGWELAMVALAPLAGNVFSPFLRFHGGTGVAALYGTWLALLGWVGPVAIGVGVGLAFIFIRETPWCVILGMFMFLVFLVLLQYPLPMGVAGIGHIALMGYNRRRHFTHRPKMQAWTAMLSNGKGAGPHARNV
jgi:acyl phosphate:glycerol-3-phosphate acyltransferase